MRHFIEEDRQMANKGTKRYFTSSATREIRIKVRRRDKAIRRDKIKHSNSTKFRQWCGVTRCPHNIATGNAKGHSSSGKELGSDSKPWAPRGRDTSALIPEKWEFTFSQEPVHECLQKIRSQGPRTRNNQKGSSWVNGSMACHGLLHSDEKGHALGGCNSLDTLQGFYDE